MSRTRAINIQLSGAPVRGVALLWRRLNFRAATRADVWQLLGDVVASGVELEEALKGEIRSSLRTGNRTRARVLAEMVSASLDGRLAQRLAPYTWPPERLILAGLGRQPAHAVLASAARLLRTRLALRKAVNEAIALPVLLALSLFALVLFFGLELLPALSEIVDFSTLGAVQGATVRVTLALSGNPARLVLWVAVASVALIALMRLWTGAGRAFGDRFPPFSIMRLQAGIGFLFAVIEHGRGGTVINGGLLEEMAQSTGRYEASRIRAVSAKLGQNANLGEAALEAGQGFPDDRLAGVLSQLWNRPDGIHKAGRFLDRRLEQIESTVKARMAALNMVLLVLVTTVLVLLMSIMLPVFDQINRGAGL
ncbi:hypothetical protein [Ruegeria sp.]|uniref:hypothetical protein n=1 Tax=Ruegeria sp. TaxID=1879320 RepID=UPI003AFFCE5F